MIFRSIRGHSVRSGESGIGLHGPAHASGTDLLSGSRRPLERQEPGVIERFTCKERRAGSRADGAPAARALVWCSRGRPGTVTGMAELSDAWGEYKRRQRLVRIALIAAVPSVAVGLLLRSVIGSVVIAVFWLSYLTFAVQRLEAWLCPRCGKTFCRRGAWHNSFTESCMNCGLPRWAPDQRALASPGDESGMGAG